MAPVWGDQPITRGLGLYGHGILFMAAKQARVVPRAADAVDDRYARLGTGLANVQRQHRLV